jgi:MoxR-like ATPase
MTYKSRINSILNLLNKGLYEREEIIAITLLSALSEQNIFLFGPPGTAKSLISRRLSKAFETDHYFEHLMQKFSTPEEVFGPISITELKKDNYIRKTEGFLPEAEFAFLDEIWKSSPAILNTLLTIINEKKFKNGSEVKSVPLKVLISASNEIPPENQGLDALYDRFLTRLLVPPVVRRNNFETILQNGSSSDEIAIPDNLKIKNEELKKWKGDINKIKLSADTLNIINGIRLEFEKLNRAKKKQEFIYVSDRRWQKAATLLKASAFFCDREETNIADCLLLSHCLWTSPDNREKVKSIVESTIETNGFQTGFSLLELDKEKDNIEKEIQTELYYSTDIYDTKMLNNKAYFEVKRDNIVFYILKSKLKSKDSFYPIDKNGNEMQNVECTFDNQGSCNIKIKNTGYYERWYDEDPYTPKVLYHKGDKKNEVNERLIKALSYEVSNISNKINEALKNVIAKKEIFLNELETPFLSEEKLAITIASITKQVEELQLRIKDCDRLSDAIGYEEVEVVPMKSKNNHSSKNIIVKPNNDKSKKKTNVVKKQHNYENDDYEGYMRKPNRIKR